MALIDTSFSQLQNAASALLPQNREPTIAYGIGRAIRKFYKWMFPTDPALKESKAQKKAAEEVDGLAATAFPPYYDALFPQDTIRIFHILNSGSPTANSLAYVSSAARHSVAPKKIQLLGVVAGVGKAGIRELAMRNAARIMDLAGTLNVPLYEGAEAPLGIEHNATAIAEMAKALEKMHFYGFDGLGDVAGWKANIKPNIKPIAGHKAMAQVIITTPETEPITLVCNGPLTTVSKTLSELATLDPTGAYAKKMVLVISGGCQNPTYGCDAPHHVQERDKIAEFNFNFDPAATQIVFTTCKKLNITIVLAGLDASDYVLWLKSNADTLRTFDNPLSQQMANVTDQIPYFDEERYPATTYTVTPLIATASITYPRLYLAKRVSVSIGDVGQMYVNETATDGNVVLLSMNWDQRKIFYQVSLQAYNQCFPGSTNVTCAKSNLPEALAIALPLSIGILGLVAFGAKKLYDKKKRNEQEDSIELPASETSKLL